MFWIDRGFDLGGFAVGLVGQKVLSVGLHQVGVALDIKQVLGVLVLGLVGEIEAAGDDRLFGR